MLINGTDITTYKAELLDRAISTTVVNSVTDWLDGSVEGTLLRQSYDWRNLKLVFLIREVNEDEAYKRISALTEALMDCTLRFDDIELDFPCILDGSTIPDRLQNGVFKVIFNLKNDWGYGEVVEEEFPIETVEGKLIHVDFVRNWYPTVKTYSWCFTEDELYETVGQQDIYIDPTLIPTIASGVESWEEFFLGLGLDLNAYRSTNELPGFLDIAKEYSVEAASTLFDQITKFTVYYNRYQCDGYPDIPGPYNYPSLVWSTGSENQYYFDLGVGAGWNIQDLTVSLVARYNALADMSNGPMFGAYTDPYCLTQNAEKAIFWTGGENYFGWEVYQEDQTASGKNVIITTLEDIAYVPLREHAIKSSNQGTAPIEGLADLVFNGQTLTRVRAYNYTLAHNLTIACGRAWNEETQTYATNFEVARIRVWYKNKLVCDYIPIASSLKNCFYNDWDVGLYDTLNMEYIPWKKMESQGPHPVDGLLPIPPVNPGPKPPEPPKELFRLEVTNGSGSGKYEKGAMVQAQMTVPEGYIFDNWTVDEGPLPEGADVTQNPLRFAMPDHNVTLTGNMHVKPIEYQPGWLLYDGGYESNGARDLIAQEREPNLGSLATDWSTGPGYGHYWVCLWAMPDVQPSNRTYSPSGKMTYYSGQWYTSADGKRRWGEKFYSDQSSGFNADIEGYYQSKAYRQTYRYPGLFG